MRKLSKYIVSGLVIASFSFGGVLGASSQNVQAADTSNQDRQKQLEEWQKKLTEWQMAQQSQQAKPSNNSSSNKSSSQPAAPATTTAPTPTATSDTSNAPLPNTGPGQVVTIFAVATIAGYVAHYSLRRQQLN